MQHSLEYDQQGHTFDERLLFGYVHILAGACSTISRELDAIQSMRDAIVHDVLETVQAGGEA